jgi:hypothetical protein
MSKKQKQQSSANIVQMMGQETAFITDLMVVVQRHEHQLTVRQMVGALFSVAHDILMDEETIEHDQCST